MNRQQKSLAQDRSQGPLDLEKSWANPHWAKSLWKCSLTKCANGMIKATWPLHCQLPGIFISSFAFFSHPTNFSPWNCPKMDSSSNPQIMAEWIPAGMGTPWHRHLRHEDNAPVRTILAAKNDEGLIWGESTGMACTAWFFSLFGLLACPFMTKTSKHLPSLTYQTGVQPLWFPCFPARHAMWAMCQVSRLLGWNLSHGQWWGVVSWLKKNEILTAMINVIIMGY